MTSKTECREVQITRPAPTTVKVTWKGECNSAAYSYINTGPAGYDVNKDQTLLNDSAESGHVFTLEGCGLDFQIDVFTGKTINPLGPKTEHYDGRLVDAKHYDGTECETTTTSTSTTSTTQAPTTTSTALSTTTSTTQVESTTTTDPGTTTTALATTTTARGVSVFATTPAPTTSTTQPPAALPTNTALPFTGDHIQGLVIAGTILVLGGVAIARKFRDKVAA